MILSGTKVFILTHLDDATKNLYKLVHRYHDNMPEPMKATTGASNSSELVFSTLDSGYAIGTAGSGSVGRSDTIQLLHGSEVGFWKNKLLRARSLARSLRTRTHARIQLAKTFCDAWAGSSRDACAKLHVR